MKLYRAAVPAAAITLAVLLSGCTPIADVEPAADAGNPDCAEVMVSLPSELAGVQQRETDSQATAAWGDPSQVILRCGVPVPGPTTEQCATVNGIDWILTEQEAGDGETDAAGQDTGLSTWTATTYGREPAIELVFDPEQISSSTILVQLENAVSRIEPTRECVASNDLELPAS